MKNSRAIPEHPEVRTDGGSEQDRVEQDADGRTIRLYGGGPVCPGCYGPTYRVADDHSHRPWWCPECNVRFTEDGEFGSHAHFPSGVEVDDAE